MALHFETAEFEARKAKVLEEMARRDLDALLLFAPESQYWLTGFDSFGFVLFQCLVLTRDGGFTLLTRSPDLRQARRTSLVEEIVIWIDRPEADPAGQLRDLLDNLDLLGKTIGIEYDTHGLTAANGRDLDEALRSFGELKDASRLVAELRAFKSAAEIAYVRRAAELADEALDAALAKIKAGADEGDILAAMQGAVFAGGGDYPGNPFIVGSGPDALLCRNHTGRRKLSKNDQITLEFAGVYRLYHAALMETVIVGKATAYHRELRKAAAEALEACQDTMRPDNTFGEVFAAYAKVMEAHGLTRHRLNACGYSLGASFAPSWMDWPMFYRDNPTVIRPDMILFAHMIIMDSDKDTAMCLGRTFRTTEAEAEPLSRHGTKLITR